MPRNKKLKTIAGYLRSMDNELSYRQSMAELQGKPTISDADGERQILNSLLPQIGIVGQIDSNEEPIDGLQRLRQSAQTDRDIQNLDTCLKWVRRSKLIEVTAVAKS